MPAAKPNTLSPAERKMRRLILAHRLRTIELVVWTDSVLARALPDLHGELVQQRVRDAFAGKESVSIAEAEQVREEAIAKPVAHARGKNLAEAVDLLAEALEAVKKT